MKLVPNWRGSLRWASIQLAGLGAALSVAWLAVPEDLKASFPAWAQDILALLIFVGVIVGRLWDQGAAE